MPWVLWTDETWECGVCHRNIGSKRAATNHCAGKKKREAKKKKKKKGGWWL